MTDCLRILFVCTGNICRSPMAEGIARARIELDYPDALGHVLAGSAGVAALEGDGVTHQAALVMGERGIDITEHRARPVTADLLEGYDLVLAMEERQRLFAQGEKGSVPSFLLLRLGEAAARLVETSDGVCSITSLRFRLERLLSFSSSIDREGNWGRPGFSYEVGDPIGLSLDEYSRVADELEGPIDGILRVLLSGSAAVGAEPLE